MVLMNMLMAVAGVIIGGGLDYGLHLTPPNRIK